MSILKYRDKIQVLFQKIYESDFLLDTYHSESLLRNLELCVKSAVKDAEINFLSDLLHYAIRHVEATVESVYLFTQEFVKLAIDNKQTINKVELTEYLTQCLQILKRENSSIPLQLSTLRLMTSLVPHRSGINWIIDNKVWQYSLQEHRHGRAKKVDQATYHFISLLVLTLDQNEDEANLMEVLNYILKPIMNNGYCNVNTLDVDNGDEQVIIDTLRPYLNTLCTLLADIENQPTINRLKSLFKNYFVMDYHIYLMGNVTRNQEMASITTQVLFYVWKHGQEIQRSDPAENSFELLTVICGHLSQIMIKGFQYTLASLMEMNLLWIKMEKSKLSNSYERNGKTFEVDIQLIALLMVPFLVYAETGCNKYEDMYIRYKLYNLLNEHTVKVAYIYRDYVQSQRSNMKKNIILNLKECSRLLDLISISQAGIVYQALHYVLETYGCTVNDKIESEKEITQVSAAKSIEDLQIITLSLDLVKSLLTKYDINWYENVEIVNLQNILLNLITINDLPTRQIVQILEVIEICVKKFLSPDLSLLIESKNGSTMKDIGQLLATLIHHEAWEIRDSTLSVLLICIKISFVKYAPMQQIIIDNNLTTPIVALALTDDEDYVQANALQCLATTAMTDSLWCNILETHPDLLEHVIEILSSSHNSLVRKEAVTVLISVYVNQQLSDSVISKLCSLMTKVIFKETQWEVQISVLGFWKHIIQNELNCRGMIDGKFPSVTFSKEKRKIVVLNEKEIQKQLTGVMDKLSSNGCLAALNYCLNKEFNLHLIQEAYNVADNLVTILENYNFQATCTQIQSTVIDKECSEEIVTTVEHPDLSHERDRDAIIDEILSTDMRELAIELCNKSEPNTDTDKLEETNSHDYLISVESFINNFKKVDLKHLLDSKNNSYSEFDNFSLLLDNMLDLNCETEPLECS